MPDYEIRFYHADGKLALVHMSSHESEDDARQHAQILLNEYAHFEIRDAGGRAAVQR